MTAANRKIFWVLCFSIFTTVTGVGIVVPLLPIYAREIGASGFFIGMIFGAFSLSRTAALPLFGALSDARGRKPFIAWGLISYAAVSVAFIGAHTVSALLVIRFVQGIASAMLMPVLQAYVGEIAPEGRESSLMGIFNMSVFLGLSMGPLLGGWLHEHQGLDAAFGSMGVLALVGFALSLWLLPPVSEEPSRRTGRPPRNRRLAEIVNRRVAGLFAYRVAYTACIGIIWGFLPLYLNASLGFSGGTIGLVVTTGVLVSGLVQAPMGWIADRMADKRPMVVGGGLCAAAALAGFGWADSASDFMLLSTLFGVGGGASMPALMGLAVEEGDRLEHMGSVMAGLTMAHSIGMLVGALAAGLLMDMARLPSVFAAGGLAQVFGVLLFLWLQKPNGPGGR
jgi:MFS family permease